jgi:hypothetical protein
MKKLAQLIFVALFFACLLTLTRTTWAQGTPQPAKIRPDYNYTESYGCTRCHVLRGDGGVHMAEAVGALYDSATRTFNFTGNGWLASQHSQSNYKSTQNTFCAKCHSPLQAKPEAEFRMGKSEPIEDGKMEGVTCAACHPSHTSAVVLGRRLGIYKWGMDKATPEAYEVIHHGEEDRLCLHCHTTRHNEDNPAFELMYVAGVRCIDCHMAPYSHIAGTEIPKMFHDFKVGKNLPYSCGVQGAMVQCHPEFGVESTRALIPYMKDQHRWMWPRDRTTKRLKDAADYLRLWKQLEEEAQAAGQ